MKNILIKTFIFVFLLFACLASTERNLAQAGPLNAVGYYNIGVDYAEAGRWQEAIDAFKQAITLKPDYVEAYNNLGNAYGELGRYQEAIVAYKQAIKLKPDDALAHYGLGIAYLIIRDKGSALEEYKRLKTLNPELANKLFNLINN